MRVHGAPLPGTFADIAGPSMSARRFEDTGLLSLPLLERLIFNIRYYDVDHALRIFHHCVISVHWVLDGGGRPLTST